MDKQTNCEAHVVMAHETNEGALAVIVSHGGIGELIVLKDIHMENFNISMEVANSSMRLQLHRITKYDMASLLN